MGLWFLLLRPWPPASCELISDGTDLRAIWLLDDKGSLPKKKKKNYFPPWISLLLVNPTGNPEEGKRGMISIPTRISSLQTGDPKRQDLKAKKCLFLSSRRFLSPIHSQSLSGTTCLQQPKSQEDSHVHICRLCGYRTCT